MKIPKTLSTVPLVVRTDASEETNQSSSDLVDSPETSKPEFKKLLDEPRQQPRAPNGAVPINPYEKHPHFISLQELESVRVVNAKIYDIIPPPPPPGAAADAPLSNGGGSVCVDINGKNEDQRLAMNGGGPHVNPAYKGRPSSSFDATSSNSSSSRSPPLKGGPEGGLGKSNGKGAAEENIWYVALQIVVPYLVAGLGMVGAGVVLDRVQHWRVFEAVTELFILIPTLLGLKGNLEMTLASRISTQANLGNVDTRAQYLTMAWGNLALLQVRAICLAFFASGLALLIGFIPDGGSINLVHAQILLASCLLTTSFASATLGVIMILVVYVTRKYNLNPDNFATPLAASLSDIVTLGILAIMAKCIFRYMMIYGWICFPIILGYLLCIPVWFIMCKRNSFVKTLLKTGWVPIIACMLISSVGGLILDYTVKSFNGIAVFQPVINGVGGNLVAIQASRLSTDFHKMGVPGTFLPEPPATYNLCKTYFSRAFNSKMARLLLSFALPGHVLFMFLISYIKNGRSVITPYFALFYLTVAMLQVTILLYLANVLILNMWRRKVDPDNAAIPYLTAIGDFLGIGFLSLAFICMHKISPKDPNLAYG